MVQGMAGIYKERRKTMVYKWDKGSRFSVPAQVAGEVCEELAEKGELTAKNLVDVSRPENAPLHGCFNWNNEIAAELYREEQSRHLIRCLITVPENNVVATRAYFNIVRNESEYHSINVILEVQDKYESMMAMALKELQTFEKKYAILKQLKPVFDAINEISA